MITWFTLNISLSLLALAFILCNRTAPHRLNFIVAFLALFCWLVPWNTLKGLLPDFGIRKVSIIGSDSPVLSQLTADIQQASAPVTSHVNERGIQWVQLAEPVLLILVTIGLFLFMFGIWKHIRLSRDLARSSCLANYLWSSIVKTESQKVLTGNLPDIRLQKEIPGALNTGLIRNTIWVHETLAESPYLEAILIHELRHVRCRDNIYLLIITLVENLFWWNPLTRILGHQARKFQELSCDDSCARDLPGYRDMLSNLILILTGTDRFTNQKTFYTPMFTDKNFNVERIRHLLRRNSMEKKHILSCLVLVSSSVLSISYGISGSQAQIQAESETATLILALNDRNDDGVITQDEANLFGDQNALSSQMATILMNSFEKVDKDSNGRLTFTELADIPLNFGINYQTVVPLQSVPSTASIMASNDTNGDGIITREEAEALGTPLGIGFTMFDLNSDDIVTTQELDTRRMQVEQSSLPDLQTTYDFSEDMITRYDTDQDGFLNITELTVMPIRIEELPAEAILERWDINNDSKLSANEVYVLTQEAEFIVIPPDSAARETEPENQQAAQSNDTDSAATEYDFYTMASMSIIGHDNDGHISMGLIKGRGKQAAIRGKVYAEITKSGEILYQGKIVSEAGDDMFMIFDENTYTLSDNSEFKDYYDGLIENQSLQQEI